MGINDLGESIKNYLRGKGESSSRDIIRQIQSEEDVTTGSINAKMRTLEKNGEIVKIGRGVYNVSERVKKEEILLSRIKNVLDEFDIPPSQLNINDNVRKFYEVYGKVEEVYNEYVDVEAQNIHEILDEIKESKYIDEECLIKVLSIEISTVEVPFNPSLDEGNAYNFVFRVEYGGNEGDYESVYGVKYEGENEELKDEIVENIISSVKLSNTAVELG